VVTVALTTELAAPAPRVWGALQYPGTFLHVCRGVLGFPALEGRTDPFRVGEEGRGWLLLFHVIPLSIHRIRLVELDEHTMTMRTEEGGGLLRTWNHTLHVDPLGPTRSSYTDTIDLDAGALTPVVARVATWLFRYRQMRWRRLARRHLQPRD
jgi:hypothetical protein